MKTKTDLLLDVLFRQVKSVPDQPKRILFKGVSNLSDDFKGRVATEKLDWDVRVTGQDEDVVGARNDAGIGTLVVFYHDEVRARESLNAFRLFNEDAVAEALVQFILEADVLPDEYKAGDIERLNFLLDLVYPSAEQLATFLLQGKDKVGKALPTLGLFSDETLTYDSSKMPLRQWQARLRDNHKAAVLRWRDFLEKGQRNRDARELLGSARRALLEQAETEPRVKEEVLREITLSEALSVLNPPSQTVLRLMNLGMLRHEAEAFVEKIKDGTIDPENLPGGTPSLPAELVTLLKRYVPKTDDSDDDDDLEPDSEVRRISFCLEGVLRVAGQIAPLPARLGLKRADRDDNAVAYITIDANEKIQVSMTADVTRALAVPNEGASELRFKLFNPEIKDENQQGLAYFSLENLAGRIEGYEEFWPEPSFWAEVAALYPDHASLWQELAHQTKLLRDIIDPDWKPEREGEEEAQEAGSREPNNPIYLIFDLVYLAHRSLFEQYFDAWLKVITLPWRADVASQDWWVKMIPLLRLGLARSGTEIAVLPFHPVRLAWHRTVFHQIEQWLARATYAYQPLQFEPGILSTQLQPIDRPRVLFQGKARLVEASRATFFSIFTSEEKKQRTRTPLDRARMKLEQFGRMWPFSLSRLHLTFQPGDAGDDIYRLLIQQADNQPNSAFRVRAMVDNTTIMTAFDRFLMTTTDQTTDLLTQEHFESMLPRVEYTKGQIESEVAERAVTTHAALVIDAFREEGFNFQLQPGQIKNNHWEQFRTLAKSMNAAALQQFKEVDLSANSYHSQQRQNGLRELVYVPIAGNGPEMLRLLYDSLVASVQQSGFSEGVYYEIVRWDAKALHRLHNQADWVILFDRTLDKAFFEQELTKEGIKLIDFYTNLRGGYRLSVSSQRIEAVKWQLVQVLQQFFYRDDLDFNKVAENMLDSLAGFASGLLLKTLGGGSLTQELLGLYATYLSLLDEKVYIPNQDLLVPLDNYQNWFGRRTQRGRRADLMVLRNRSSKRLELIAVESKWYKNLNSNIVFDEFGPDGQLRHTVRSLRSLFDPHQDRLDKSYWQRTLQGILNEAPDELRHIAQDNDMNLRVDGFVYVHQYTMEDQTALTNTANELNDRVKEFISSSDASDYFGLGPAEQRLKMKSYPELVSLFQKKA